MEQKIAALTEQVEKLKGFVASRGLGEAFVEFVKSLAPKTMKQKPKRMLQNTTNSERTISRQLQERINRGSRNCRFYKERFDFFVEQMVKRKEHVLVMLFYYKKNVINNIKTVENTTI